MTTREQREALWQLYNRRTDPFRPSYLTFRRSAIVSFSYGCVMVPWLGMVFGIEKDGYTHT